MSSIEAGWLGRPLEVGSLRLFARGAHRIARELGTDYTPSEHSTGIVYLTAAALNWAITGAPRADGDPTLRNPAAVRIAEPEDVLKYAAGRSAQDQLGSYSAIPMGAQAWCHTGEDGLGLVVLDDSPNVSIADEAHSIRNRFDPGYNPAVYSSGANIFIVPMGSLAVVPDDIAMRLAHYNPHDYARAVIMNPLAYPLGD